MSVTRRDVLSVSAAALAASCTKPKSDLVVDDASHLNPTRVKRIVTPTTAAAVREAVLAAKSEGLHVIASGTRHSQGGHAMVRDGVVIDMRSLAGVVKLDDEAQTVTVQAGCSWDALQRALNPKGLAIRTMQSSNIFTVGGSLSSNIHGRDVNDGLFITSVKRFTLLDARGELHDVARGDPLFPAVIGGFGLFGVVLEVELQLAQNAVLAHDVRVVDAAKVPETFQEHVAGREALFIARPSIAPSSFLKETIFESWSKVDEPMTPALQTLGEEEHVARDRLIFDASRASAAGKETRWGLQRHAAEGSPKRVTRNNAMRPPTTPLAFLMRDSDKDTDIVSEYFVPVARYGDFLEAARAILLAEKTNLLGLTLRFVKGNDEGLLTFAPQDAFAFMFYTNHEKTPAGRAAAERMSGKLFDAALAGGGRHYLTYQTWPTREQVVRAYPRFDVFAKAQREADPDRLFWNGFAEAYLA